MLAIVLAACALADDYTPFVHGPSKEAETAMTGFELAPGIKVELVAAEPLLANPVGFTIDRTGRIFVAETFRLHAGVTDTRGHMYWLDDDLACRTVADRVAMYKKHIKDVANWAVEHDRIKVLWSSTGSSKPDKSAVFADGFHKLEDGLGSGVLVRDDAVYYTCIPDLWKLAPTKAGEKSPKRESLATGFGVHTGFIGHDLHGLTLGPDGRLYFSIGDRGLRLKTKEGVILNNPDSGAVLRCEQDGSKLEFFCSGLRNPQELAFNDVGDLFTCDNNSDGGDKARWLHLVDGGEYGWRMGYQYMEDPILRGPWNNELLWQPDVADRAAYLIPPIRNFSDGPSGLVFDPGVTRLGDRWKGAFFLCDFRGTPGQSGIRTAWLKRKGAGYEFDRDDRIVWRTLATDCEFGPDGSLYLSDWVDGWNKPNKGRIYRLFDPSRDADPRLAQMQKLFREGFRHRPPKDLLSLLDHPDRRIRQEAQEALVAKKAVSGLREAATQGPMLRRLHGIWGLACLLRTGTKSDAAVASLRACLNVDDPHVRAKAAIALAEAQDVESAPKLVELLKDADPRVQRDAALALGRLDANAMDPAVKNAAARSLTELGDKVGASDPILRHALVMAMANCGMSGPAELSANVRLLEVLVWRRWRASFLADRVADADPFVALEAARAIYDSISDRADSRRDLALLPNGESAFLNDATAALAKQATEPKHWADPYLRRVAAANYRLGAPEHAGNLAALAAQKKTPRSIRKESLYELAHWAKPNGKDRVLGNWRPIDGRSAEPAKAALVGHKEKLFIATAADADARRQLIEAVRLLDAKELLADVRAVSVSEKETSVVRIEALKTLAALKDSSLREAVARALESKDDDLRAEARRHLASIDPAAAVPALEQVLKSGGRAERQAALATLATIAAPAAEAALLKALEQLTASQFSRDAELDLLLAAEAKGTPALKTRLSVLAATRDKKDALAEYRACLEGGDPRQGKRIFDTKAEVYCLRCHRVGSAGGEVGPNLKEIAQKKTREYILESIVDPNAKIAEGFESVLLELEDGRTVIGVLRSETPAELRIITPDAKNLVVPKKDVAERRRGPSAMPQDAIKHLSKRELRDLVEYLVVQPKN